LIDVKLKTPVLLLIFNRPDRTQELFNVIRKVKPAELYIAADGARAYKQEDLEKCRQARDVVNQVDWDCRVQTLFRDENMGCRRAIASAINWFFDNVEEGIILEDDCLPSESFFRFCEELLGKYRHDQRIMQISGNNYLFGKKQFNESYYFSKLNGCWGWATWRRAWKHFDGNMPGFAYFKRENLIANYIDNKEMSDWLLSYLEEAATPGCSIWSSQWSYAIVINNGLCISPAVNLVQNTGLGEDATHGKNRSFKLYSEVKAEELKKIIHPMFILADNEADNIYFDIIKKTDPRLIHKNSLKLAKHIKKIIPTSVKDTIKSFLRRGQ
jgi:hypothetical protein